MSTSLKQAIEAAKVRVSSAYDAAERVGAPMPPIKDLASLPASLSRIPSLKQNGLTFAKNSGYGDHAAMSSCYVTSFGDLENLNNLFGNNNALKNVVFDDDIDTSKIRQITYLFNNCKTLKSIDISMFELTPGTTAISLDHFAYLCQNASVIKLPKRNLLLSNMSYTFFSCYNVLELDLSNFSANPGTTGLNSSNAFYGLISLRRLIFGEGWKCGFNISASVGILRDGLVEMFNSLPTIEETQTITLGSAKLALLSNADKAIATSKGWTLA